MPGRHICSAITQVSQGKLNELRIFLAKNRDFARYTASKRYDRGVHTTIITVMDVCDVVIFF
jgi:hypothetical protein